MMIPPFHKSIKSSRISSVNFQVRFPEISLSRTPFVHKAFTCIVQLLTLYTVEEIELTSLGRSIV